MRIIERCRLPGVDQNSAQLLPSNCFSSWIVCWISSNSTLTRASSSSPCACTYARTFLACSSLPLEISHLGDSGTVLNYNQHTRKKKLCIASFSFLPDEDQLTDRRDSLQKAWNTPRPGTPMDMICALKKCKPSCIWNGEEKRHTQCNACTDQATHIPKWVIDSTVDSSVLGMYQLSDQKRWAFLYFKSVLRGGLKSSYSVLTCAIPRPNPRIIRPTTNKAIL